MTPSVNKLFLDALTLSDEEQLQLVAALTASIEERGIQPFDETWLEEIRRLSDVYDAGGVESIPWEEVKRRARQRKVGEGS